MVLVAVALAACGAQRAGDDGAAVAACRDVLEEVTAPERLATTVREQDPGFVVSAWRTGRAEGRPDYLCRVARDGDAAGGVVVRSVQTRDGDGGYSSTLDLDFDDEVPPR